MLFDYTSHVLLYLMFTGIGLTGSAMCFYWLWS